MAEPQAGAPMRVAEEERVRSFFPLRADSTLSIWILSANLLVPPDKSLQQSFQKCSLRVPRVCSLISDTPRSRGRESL